MEKRFTLNELISIHREEVQELLSTPDRYSVYEDYDEFQIFVIRRMILAQQSLGFATTSFLFKGATVYLFNIETSEFTLLDLGFSDLLKLIEGYYKENQRIIGGYSAEIEKLEDFLFARDIPQYFMDLWFDLKKDLSRIENYYYRNVVVYREFLRKSSAHFKDLSDEFKDIEENIQFQSTNVQTLKTRLDGLHHYYDSIKHDRLNKTLLTLTVISGVFLPLNLIVGFFGMNTPGLYFGDSPDGTRNVVVLLGAVIIVCLTGLKVARLVDTYILRALLGRYDFYKSIANRLNKIDESFKIK